MKIEDNCLVFTNEDGVKVMIGIVPPGAKPIPRLPEGTDFVPFTSGPQQTS